MMWGSWLERRRKLFNKSKPKPCRSQSNKVMRKWWQWWQLFSWKKHQIPAEALFFVGDTFCFYLRKFFFAFEHKLTGLARDSQNPVSGTFSSCGRRFRRRWKRGNEKKNEKKKDTKSKAKKKEVSEHKGVWNLVSFKQGFVKPCWLLNTIHSARLVLASSGLSLSSSFENTMGGRIKKRIQRGWCQMSERLWPNTFCDSFVFIFLAKPSNCSCFEM